MENNPTYNISISVNDDIVDIVIRGEVIKNCVEELVKKFFDIANRINAKYLLVDIRALKGRFHYVGESLRSQTYPILKPKLRIAVIDIAENAKYELPLEKTADSVGIKLKWFTDIDEARVWLQGKGKKTVK
jgi:hypothetical protein